MKDGEHDDQKERDSEDPVGEYPVGPVTRGKLFPASPPGHRRGQSFRNMIIAPIRQDALEVVAEVVGRHPLRPKICHFFKQRRRGLFLQFIPLQSSDGPEDGMIFPGLAIYGQSAFKQRLEGSPGQHTAPPSGAGGRLISRAHQLIQVAVFQGRNDYDGYPQGLRQLFGVEGSPLFFHRVGHIQRDHHRDIGLQQLGRQVKVPLQIGGVHHIQNEVRLPAEQKIPGYFLLRGIG